MNSFSDGGGAFDESSDELSASRQSKSVVEEAVWAASGYVVPSDDLRPRTLEAAREVDQDRHRLRKFERFMVGFLAICVLSIPLVDRLNTWRDNHQAPTSTQIEQMALEYSKKSADGQHWGMYETYNRIRHAQAARFGHAISNRVD